MDIGGKVGLVYHQNIGVRDARPILAGNLVSRRHINHIDKEIDQCGAEGEREVIATRLNQHHIAIGETLLHLLHRRKVHRRIFPDGCVGAGTCLHAHNSLLGKHTLQYATHVLGILGGDDIVGDNQHLMTQRQQSGRDSLYYGSLTRTYGASDANSATIIHCLKDF